MIVQINTDNNLTIEQRSIDFFTTQISEALDRFESNITRVEVHLKDENGAKDGINDISCTMEARLEGKSPIAISNQANTVELAMSGAISKTKSAIDTIVSKSQKY